MSNAATDLLIKQRLETILKLRTRIEEKSRDIENGDVSPFFCALFGEDITLYTKVAQSIQTTFGMSFYEQVCKILGESKGYEVNLQHKILGELNHNVKDYLSQTLDVMGYRPDREQELSKIKELTTAGNQIEYPDSTVDVFIKKPDGQEIYIDITTVKPNKKEFRTMKRKILTWTAMRWSVDPTANVQAYMAIPYNPEPGDYSRHNSNYDRRDILVGDELWALASGGEYNVEKLEAIFSDLSSDVSEEINKLIKR